MTADEYRAELAAVYDRYHVHLWRLWCATQPWGPNARTDWSRWHRIADRGHREYNRIEHRSHGTTFPTFRPLWCAACQRVAA